MVEIAARRDAISERISAVSAMLPSTLSMTLWWKLKVSNSEPAAVGVKPGATGARSYTGLL